jgi:hypothetical protein
MSDQSTAPVRMMTKEASFRGHSIPHSLWDSSKAPSGHQLQGAEAPGALKEDMGISPEKIYCLFCGGNKGHNTRTCQITIPKQKRDCRSRSSAESAEASLTYYFVPLSLHTRICGQSSYSFYCFGKPFTCFLASTPSAATTATYLFPKPAARRAPALPTAT